MRMSTVYALMIFCVISAATIAGAQGVGSVFIDKIGGVVENVECDDGGYYSGVQWGDSLELSMLAYCVEAVVVGSCADYRYIGSVSVSVGGIDSFDPHASFFIHARNLFDSETGDYFEELQIDIGMNTGSITVILQSCSESPPGCWHLGASLTPIDLDCWTISTLWLEFGGSFIEVRLSFEGDVDDCNGNGISDAVDLAAHPDWDWNNDGLIDNCQQGGGLTGVPSGGSRNADLHDAYPNPFNPQTTISFSLPERRGVWLRVFDVSGRLVRVLIGGDVQDQGRHETVWNGRDDAGRRVAGGAYFYRLDTGGYSETKRMVLVK